MTPRGNHLKKAWEIFRKLQLEREKIRQKTKEEIKIMLRRLNYYDAIELLKDLLEKRDWVE